MEVENSNQEAEKQVDYDTVAVALLNAFSKGGIFDADEIRAFLKGLGKDEQREYFEPCSNSSIIIRMLTNLINSFQQVGNKEKVNELTELRQLFDANQ